MEKLLAKPVGLVAAGIMLIVATLVPNGLAAAHFEVEENEPGESLKLGGTIEAISENSITILGLQFQVNEATDIEGILRIGEFAKVEFNVAEGTTLVALEIEAEDELDENDGDDQDDPEDEDLEEEETEDLEDAKATGVVEAFSESSITINGQVYTFDGDTELDEGLQVGAIATIEFVTLPDGTLLATEVETDADDDAGEDDQDDDEDEDEDEEEDDEEDEDDDNSGSGSSGEEHEDDGDDD